MKKFFSTSHAVSIQPSTIIFAVFFILGLYFLYFIHEILMTFLLALIMMSALHPALRWMQRKLHIPKPLGIVFLYILVISFVVLTFSLIVPPLFTEVPTLVRSLDLPPLPVDFRSVHFSIEELKDIFGQFQSSFGTVYTVISSTFSSIFAFFTVLVMSAYLLLDRDSLHKRVAWFTQEPKALQNAKEFVDSLEVQLGGWVRGQVLLMITIGLSTYLGLFVFGVPYALPLALAAGFLEILPNLGPTLSAIPAIVVAFAAGGWQLASVVTILYVVIQQLENHLIVPKVMKENAGVSPLITILSILIGLKLAGVMGALLAIPVYIIVRTVYAFWLREDGEKES